MNILDSRIKDFIKILVFVCVVLFAGVFILSDFFLDLAVPYLKELDLSAKITIVAFVSMLGVAYQLWRKDERRRMRKPHESEQQEGNKDELFFESLKVVFADLALFAAEIFLSIFIFFIASYFIMTLFGKLQFDLENKADFLTLLEVLLGFIGVIGAGIYIFISNAIGEKVQKELEKMKNEMKECFAEERKMSRADSSRTLGFMFMRFYEEVYKEKTRKTCEESKCEDYKGFKQIKSAISRAEIYEKLMDEMKGRQDYEYLFAYYLSKNNLAFYLERKWNFYRSGESEEQFKTYLSENGLEDNYHVDKVKVFELLDVLKFEKAATRFSNDFGCEIHKTETKVNKTFTV